MCSKLNIVTRPVRGTTSPLLGLFDDSSYASLAVTHSAEYQNASPFPYIVFDNFLPDNLAIQVAQGYPDPRDENVSWRHHSNHNTSRKFLDDETQWSQTFRQFARETQSRRFLLFLEELSGIESLLCDPYYIGGGAMASGPGDFLNVHQDFNWHHKLQAHRRLNALFYLTPNWDAAWGGNLELWSASGPEISISPLFNRVVIFSTLNADHGQPEPVSCPSGIYRCVFSAFYYTARATDVELEEPHFTRYRPDQSVYGMQLREKFRESAQGDKKGSGY